MAAHQSTSMAPSRQRREFLARLESDAAIRDSLRIIILRAAFFAARRIYALFRIRDAAGKAHRSFASLRMANRKLFQTNRAAFYQAADKVSTSSAETADDVRRYIFLLGR